MLEARSGYNACRLKPIVLFKCWYDAGHTNSQKKLTYVEVLTIGDDNDLSPPATKVSENVNFQKYFDRSPSKIPSDGFVGVEWKRKNFKQFFVSGFSKDVKDSQIALYLVKRNVIPSYISIFPSKRTGTISAKVGIPQASVSKVQEQNFWPRFVCCKPSQQKDKRSPLYPRDPILTAKCEIMQHMYNGRKQSVQHSR